MIKIITKKHAKIINKKKIGKRKEIKHDTSWFCLLLNYSLYITALVVHYIYISYNSASFYPSVSQCNKKTQDLWFNWKLENPFT